MTQDVYVDAALASWSILSDAADQPPSVVSGRQCVWDRPVIVHEAAILRESYTDEQSLARLSAVSAPHSGD